MKSCKPINEQILLVIFAVSILAVMHIGLRVTDLSVNKWSQYLAYLAGFLLAVDFLGKERVTAADAVVSSNADYMSSKFTDFLLFYFLIKVDDPKERREIGAWYLFCILDTVLLFILYTHTLPSLDINVHTWLKANNIRPMEISMWIMASMCLFAVISSLLMVLAFFLKPWCRRVIATAVKGGFILSVIAWMPICFIMAPITFPWLVAVGATWLVLQALLLVVRLKARLRLGNLFVVFGVLLLFASFLLFILEQLKNK